MTTILDRRTEPTAEPAFGVGAHDVRAVNAKAGRELYASRQKIHPKLAHGTFRGIKWLMMAVTLGIYYVLPWMRWSRGGDLPDQAVLIDMASNRYFFFFLEIWPQEFYYITGLLVLGALLLFLVTSVMGRAWCGYICPQTVWTDVMITIERFWQGDRNARIRLDKAPWGIVKIIRKVMTHLSWLLVGLLTGGALVFYFRDAPTLAREFVSGTAPAVAYMFLGIFALTTYVLGGIAREQVCTYMCPWPRIQGAMTDRHTLLVGYREERGEPRGPARKRADGTVDWTSRGDCIDCKACVVVCPAGIDIRDGAQLECIQCALCIDPCDEIMIKIGRPRGLVAYDTMARKEATVAGRHEAVHLLRPRTMLYAAMAALVALIMLGGWLNRTTLDVNVLTERNPPFVLLSDGTIRNAYAVKILNKLHEPRTFIVAAQGLPGARVSIVGLDATTDARVTVPTDAIREFRALVSVGKTDVARFGGMASSFDLVVTDTGSGRTTRRTTHFRSPAKADRSAP